MPFHTHDPPDQASSGLYLAGRVRSRTRPATVLVVDHDAAVRDALSLTLRSNGFIVNSYGSAEELLMITSIARDGCFLIEYDLKEMNGIELLTRLNARRIKLPAVIMSARLRPLVFAEPEPPGIAAILQKPFGQDDLLRCLRHALGHP